MNKKLQIHLLLQLADNALVLGHRLSEWCGHGPILEQDIAVTNLSLDQLGQARSFYQYAADVFNSMDRVDKQTLFASVALQNKADMEQEVNEDDLAYLRDAWDFRNLLLVELPNTDWAYTVLRSFLFDAFNYLYFKQLTNSVDDSIAAVAAKSVKEIQYHLRWSKDWVIRLGDGTETSWNKLNAALNDIWTYTGEMFMDTDCDKAASELSYAPAPSSLHSDWLEEVTKTFQLAKLTVPNAGWMQTGGKTGTHTEHLGYILTELQYMQRVYPDMQW